MAGQEASPEVLELRTALAAAQEHAVQVQIRADEVAAELANTKALNADLAAQLALQELQIAKMKRDLYGAKAERSIRLIEQLELSFEEAEAAASEDEALALQAAAKTSAVTAFERKRPRRQLPEHLPRERVVVPAPEACPCCGSDALSKLGEDITETLEVIPRQWKVIQTVREKFSCRSCETITQPPAPFHVTPRGFFGPSLLAMIAFEKFSQHQPFHRQCDRYAREGVEISPQTLADQFGAMIVTLRPLFMLIEAHVMAAQRLHADETTVPVAAKYKTDTAYMWGYVRDDQPFGATAPPAVIFHFARGRGGAHPLAHLAHYQGILQADAYGGYNALLKPDRSPAPLVRALCWAHARRYFFELADIARQLKKNPKRKANISPLALEAVQRIDAIFAIERDINGKSAEERRAVRQQLLVPLVADLESWMRQQRARLSRHDCVAEVMDYMLKDWDDFTRFLDDGRICLTNNAAERALRGIALGRKAWLFCGSDRGGQHAAFMYSLIGTAKLNNIDPQAWLEDVLKRIADISQNRLAELLPWNWKSMQAANAVAA